MRQLNGVYTQRFNRAHGRVGHVFQGRFKAILVQKESYLRARMVRSARQWRWSSYRAMVGEAKSPSWLMTDWLLTGFSRRKSQAIEKYKNFIAEGKNQPSPWEKLKNQIFLGSDEFVQALQKQAVEEKDLSEVPLLQTRPTAKPLTYYAEKHSDRDEAILAAYTSGGYGLKEIGAHFGLHYSRVSRIVRAREKVKRLANRQNHRSR